MDTPKLNTAKLTPEQRDRLEAYQQAQQQLTTINDIADMVQDISNQLEGNKDIDKVGALLVDIRETLGKLNDKEAPESPDYAKPVVEAIAKLEKALKKIDTKPEVNVAAPNVKVDAPEIDTRAIESLIKKDLPKAFDKAVKSINIPEAPKTDFAPLLDAWTGIADQLDSIEKATRLKSQPGIIKVTNPDGSSIGSLSGSTYYESFVDTTTDTNLVYLGKATAGTATSAGSWQIKRYNKSAGHMSFADDVTSFTKTWDDRTSYSY